MEKDLRWTPCDIHLDIYRLRHAVHEESVEPRAVVVVASWLEVGPSRHGLRRDVWLSSYGYGSVYVRFLLHVLWRQDSMAFQQ